MPVWTIVQQDCVPEWRPKQPLSKPNVILSLLMALKLITLHYMSHILYGSWAIYNNNGAWNFANTPWLVDLGSFNNQLFHWLACQIKSAGLSNNLFERFSPPQQSFKIMLQSTYRLATRSIPTTTGISACNTQTLWKPMSICLQQQRFAVSLFNWKTLSLSSVYIHSFCIV